MRKNGKGYEAEPEDPVHQEENTDEDTAELPVLAVEAVEDDTESSAVPNLQRSRASGAVDEPSSDARATSTWKATRRRFIGLQPAGRPRR